MEKILPSVLTIEQQEKITFTGVESVDSFSENGINLTVNGKRVQISGAHLKVLSFAKGSGNFTATGQVTGVKFGFAKGKGLQRLLK